jgi:hypothetical protein
MFTEYFPDVGWIGDMPNKRAGRHLASRRARRL